MIDTSTHKKANVIFAGENLDEAKKALILIHGRGGNAADILSIAGYLPVINFSLIAPDALNNSWYPFSFLAPPGQNEPWLSNSLNVIKDLVTSLIHKGFSTEDIYLLGFSQGACLSLEFAARNAARYGGIVAFSGGLIGDKIYKENYKGDFQGTPVFIGTSNPDPHVPVERVIATTNLLAGMHADVTQKIYDNMGHTISKEEIDLANQLIFSPAEF